MDRTTAFTTVDYFAALLLVLRRIEAIQAQLVASTSKGAGQLPSESPRASASDAYNSVSGFPLYSLGLDNHWRVTSGGSWTGGFWAGCWWLRARLTGTQGDQQQALQVCSRLRNKLAVDSLHRAMIFAYGPGLGHAWFQQPDCQIDSITARRSLTASFNPQLQAMPLGVEMGAGQQGAKMLSVDSLAALIELLAVSGDVDQQALVKQHLDTLIEVLMTASGAWYAEAEYRSGAWQPLGQAGDWARGQAWAMLGLVGAAKFWGQPYIDLARTSCTYWLESYPQSLPVSYKSRPSEGPDPCALIIAALAMFALRDRLPDEERWAKLSYRYAENILASDYFTLVTSAGQLDGLFADARLAANFYQDCFYQKDLSSLGFDNLTLSDGGLSPHQLTRRLVSYPKGWLDDFNQSQALFTGCHTTVAKGQRALAETTWGYFLLLQLLSNLLHLI